MLGRMATLKGTETLGDAVMLRHMARGGHVQERAIQSDRTIGRQS